jgi:hypothetical protein
MGRRRKYPSEIGDIVNYHSIIGEEITSTGHEVKEFGEVGGRKVAWITKKSGCVDIKALTMDWDKTLKKMFIYEHSGVKGKLKRCKKCQSVPFINAMSHGERWIDCDCGKSSGLYKDDNQPSVAMKEAAKAWNRKN